MGKCFLVVLNENGLDSRDWNCLGRIRKWGLLGGGVVFLEEM